MQPLVVSFSVSRHPSATFGEYIRKARLEKGLKQAEVARVVGVNEDTVVNWDRTPTAEGGWIMTWRMPVFHPAPRGPL